MAKWQFYVSRPSGNFWNPYETVEAGIFEGSQDEAQKELSERIRRTWSPYVTHSFEAAEQVRAVDPPSAMPKADRPPMSNPPQETELPKTAGN